MAASQTPEGAGLRWARSIFEEKPNIYGVSRSTAPIGSRVVLNYDLTPAEWASGSVTMRFLVENYPNKVIPTFFEGSTMFGRYVGYISYSRYKIEKFKTG